MYLRIIICFVGCLFFSCSSFIKCPNKAAFLERFDQFSSELDNEKQERTEKEWLSLEEEFQVFTETCYLKYKEELSVSERLEIVKHSFRYVYFHKAHNPDYQFSSSLDLEAELVELSELSGMEIKEFIRRELEPEMDIIIDDVLSDLESIGEELKNWLDNL